MHKNDGSLISFTLLAQFSVGLIWFYTFVYLRPGQLDLNLQIGGFLISPVFIALVAIALAVLLSFLHLGSPFRAPRAFANIFSSWLSLEILLLSIFGFLVLGLFIVQQLNIDQSMLFAILLGLADLTGLLLLFAMTRIYLLPTVPPWNNAFTPLQFLFSAVVSGGMVMMGFLLQNPENYPLAKNLMRILVMAIILEAGFAWLFNQHLKYLKGLHDQKPAHNTGVYFSIYVVRAFIMLVCVFFLAYLSITIHPESSNHFAIIRFYSLIFGLLILQEVAGRYLFYQSYFRIGV